MKMSNRGRPCKLTKEQLDLIVALFTSGKNYLEIAKQTGINKGSVAWQIQKAQSKNYRSDNGPVKTGEN